MMFQLKNLPDEMHTRLKVRAAQAGMSMSDYVIAELRRALDAPTRAAGQTWIGAAQFAIERLGQSARQQTFAHARWPAKEIGMRRSPASNTPPQVIDRPFVTSDVPVHIFSFEF